MENKVLSTKTLENILEKTLGALDDGRTQIYEVAEAAREECKRTEAVLNRIRVEMNQAIYDVEDLNKRFLKNRHQLYQANKEFTSYTEDEKQDIYEETAQTREELKVAEERERMLRARRDQLEQTLVKLEDIASKAERLVSQVGVALNFLAANLGDINIQLEDMQAREQAGQEILRSQEIAQRRMASELHDGPVQDLANLFVQFEIVERLYQAGHLEEAKESHVGLKGIVKDTIGELRRIIYDLNPMPLDDLGLVVTVNNFLDTCAEQTGVETKFILFGQERTLDSQTNMALFRIIQESVNNVRKHANATLITVTVEYTNQMVTVEIKDNGTGFNLQEVQSKIRSGQHYGLFSMESRVKVLQGTLSIQSVVGQGTKVKAIIPLTNGEGGNFS